MKFDNQLRYCEKIIGAFEGQEPLHLWLKQFYAGHPQMGASDRRTVTDLVFGFYRLGHSVRNLATADRVLLSLFLRTSRPIPMLEYFRPQWMPFLGNSLDEKIRFLNTEAGIAFHLEDIFPFGELLGPTVDHRSFCASLFQQPDLFLRIRPGREFLVKEKLQKAGIAFEPLSEGCLRLANGQKIEQFLELDREVVVQDLNSQRTAPFFQLPPDNDIHRSRAWDCCAGGGGKTLLLLDRFPGLFLEVSDRRPSILNNLKARLQKAGVGGWQARVLDLSKEMVPPSFSNFDLIVADVPCSGSGTWSRNPENLYFFSPQRLPAYPERQRRILEKIRPALGQKGELIYITCSVFRCENEDMLAFMEEKLGLQMQAGALLEGYGQKADSLFAARLSA